MRIQCVWWSNIAKDTKDEWEQNDSNGNPVLEHGCVRTAKSPSSLLPYHHQISHSSNSTRLSFPFARSFQSNQINLKIFKFVHSSVAISSPDPRMCRCSFSLDCTEQNVTSADQPALTTLTIPAIQISFQFLMTCTFNLIHVFHVTRYWDFPALNWTQVKVIIWCFTRDPAHPLCCYLWSLFTQLLTITWESRDTERWFVQSIYVSLKTSTAANQRVYLLCHQEACNTIFLSFKTSLAEAS